MSEQAKDRAKAEAMKAAGLDPESTDDLIWSEAQRFSQGFDAGAEYAAWVPCSERLPEQDGLYLTVCFGGGKWLFDTVRYDHQGWHVPHKALIEAWMPIPPYDKEKE